MAAVSTDKKEDDTKDTQQVGYPKSEYMDNLTEILFSAEEIQQQVARLGAQISKDYQGKKLIVVGILRGSFMFQADLVRYITVPHTIDFMMLSSYRGKKSTGNVMISKDMSLDPFEKHVLIVEDLVDTGGTLDWLQKHLKTKKAASVKLCTLLDKKTVNRVKKVKVDYIGMDCADHFVVGYGMDYNQLYRSMPCIGVLKPEVYQTKEKATESEDQQEAEDSAVE